MLYLSRIRLSDIISKHSYLYRTILTLCLECIHNADANIVLKLL